jgi:hypothetical protein
LLPRSKDVFAYFLCDCDPPLFAILFHLCMNGSLEWFKVIDKGSKLGLKFVMVSVRVQMFSHVLTDT